MWKDDHPHQGNIYSNDMYHVLNSTFFALLYCCCLWKLKLLFFSSYTSPDGPLKRETHDNLHHELYDKVDARSFFPDQSIPLARLNCQMCSSRIPGFKFRGHTRRPPQIELPLKTTQMNSREHTKECQQRGYYRTKHFYCYYRMLYFI